MDAGSVELPIEAPLPRQPPPERTLPPPLCERELAAAVPYAETIARDSFERMRKAFAESGIEVQTL